MYLTMFRSSTSVTKVELTDRLRTATIPESSTSGASGLGRAFRRTATAKRQVLAGFPQRPGGLGQSGLGRRGPRFPDGAAQVWCRIELQLLADRVETGSEPMVLPFVGSAANYFALKR